MRVSQACNRKVHALEPTASCSLQKIRDAQTRVTKEAKVTQPTIVKSILYRARSHSIFLVNQTGGPVHAMVHREMAAKDAVKEAFKLGLGASENMAGFTVEHAAEYAFKNNCMSRQPIAAHQIGKLAVFLPSGKGDAIVTVAAVKADKGTDYDRLFCEEVVVPVGGKITVHGDAMKSQFFVQCLEEAKAEVAHRGNPPPNK
jgi:hypothetical protein